MIDVVSIAVPPLYRPPPPDAAELPLMVQLVRVIAPVISGRAKTVAYRARRDRQGRNRSGHTLIDFEDSTGVVAAFTLSRLALDRRW